MLFVFVSIQYLVLYEDVVIEMTEVRKIRQNFSLKGTGVPGGLQGRESPPETMYTMKAEQAARLI